jgi:hypothetical protein
VTVFVRAVRLVLLALVIALPVWAQEKAPAPKKKPAAKTQQAVHRKPTPEQIRKFNQLEKKQAAEPAKK